MSDKAEIDQALDRIEELVGIMLSEVEDERINIYRKVDTFLLRLEKHLRADPLPGGFEKLEALKTDLIAIARLDDPDGHPDEQHREWAIEAIRNLRVSFEERHK